MVKQSVARKNWCVTGWKDKGAVSPEQFMDKYGPRGTGEVVYAAGQEEETKQQKRHYQWWFQLKKPKRFTALIGKKPKHFLKVGTCHIEPCKGTEEENEEYVKKSETGVAETLYQEGEFQKLGGGTKHMEEIVEMCREGAGWDAIYAEHAEFVMTGHHANSINHAMNYIQPAQVTEKFGMSSWPQDKGWDLATTWAKGDKLTTLILMGPAGCGKTKWAESLFFDDKPTLVCQTKDDLKKLNSKFSAVCLDDWDEELGELGPAQLTQLFDRHRDVSIKCRYNDAQIPKGTPMVVCSNNDLTWLTGKHAGVERRTTFVMVEAWDMAAAIKLAAEARMNQLVADGEDKEDKHDDDSDAKMIAFQDEVDDALNDEDEAGELERQDAEAGWTMHTSGKKRKRSLEVIDIRDTQECDWDEDED